MRLSVLAFLALIAIAATQAQQLADDIDLSDQVLNCYDKLGDPCQNAINKEEKDDCMSSFIPNQECISKCVYNNKDQLQQIVECFKSICKTENNNVQTYYGKMQTCLSGISILAFTVAASALALLL
ncbi:hypothetical protein ABPG74_018938 [Tetrahymena malaccensis]